MGWRTNLISKETLRCVVLAGWSPKTNEWGLSSSHSEMFSPTPILPMHIFYSIFHLLENNLNLWANKPFRIASTSWFYISELVDFEIKLTFNLSGVFITKHSTSTSNFNLLLVSLIILKALLFKLWRFIVTDLFIVITLQG